MGASFLGCFQKKRGVTFLSLNKKVTKEISQRVAFYKAAPLWNPPPSGQAEALCYLSAKVYRLSPSRHGATNLERNNSKEKESHSTCSLSMVHRAAERKSVHFRVVGAKSAGLMVSEERFLREGGFVKSPLLSRFLWLLSCANTRK